VRSRGSRRLAGAAISLVLGLAALVGLIALISSRDPSTFNGSPGPGTISNDAGDRHLPIGARDPAYATDPPLSGPHVVVAVRRDGVALTDDQLLTALEQGNVVLAFNDPLQARALRSLADAVGGPFDPAVAAAGQAVILDRRRAGPRGTVTALAWRHELVVGSPSDARLRAFAQYWLGRGAGGGH
jgi:hypothetical protein